MGVFTAHAHGERAVGVEQPDHIPLDLPDEHHADDVHRLRRRDPQTARELRFDAELVELRIDLWTTAMDNDRPQAGIAKERDIGGERGRQHGIGHGVSAVFDHDRAAVETRQIRQRLDECGCLRVCGFAVTGHVEYAEFSCT